MSKMRWGTVNKMKRPSVSLRDEAEHKDAADRWLAKNDKSLTRGQAQGVAHNDANLGSSPIPATKQLTREGLEVLEVVNPAFLPTTD